MISTIIDNPVQEYRVLLPSELSICVTKRPLPPLDRLVPIEETIKLCASHHKIVAGIRYNCLTGTVRSDNLPKIPHLPDFDIRSRYGGYDSSDAAGRRTCNWVRFLKVSHVYNDDVNIVGFRFGPNGEVIFEVIRDIPVGGELIAFLIPDTGSHEDSILVPALQILRSSFYRKAIDDAPLDLSRSLLSTTKWGVDSSRSRSPSPIIRRNQSSSSDADDTHSEVSPPASPISVTSLSPPPHSSGFLSSTNPFVQFGGFTFSRPLISPSEFHFPGILPVRIPNIPSPPSSASTSPKSPSSTSPVRSTQPPPPPTKRRERTMLPCDECGKAFDRPSLLKRHMRTHTGEKPHVCDVCSRAFSTSSSLNTHRRIHSGEKPHSCPVCGKRFTASSNLYYHKMTHVKEKPHKCGLCTRSFPTPGDLRSHMFVHNGQWPHKCNVCGKGFSKNTNLRNHLFHHTATKSKL